MYFQCRLGMFLSIFIVAAIFVPTLYAIQCNHFEIQHITTNAYRTYDCLACTAYICSVNGNIISGTTCIENIKEICQQKWKESDLNSIVEGKYQEEIGQFFLFSCKQDRCNTVNWFFEKIDLYEKIIEDAELPFQKLFAELSHQKLSSGISADNKALTIFNETLAKGIKTIQDKDKEISATGIALYFFNTVYGVQMLVWLINVVRDWYRN